MTGGCSARLAYRPEYASYDFGPGHPLRVDRLRTSMDLFSALGILPPVGDLLSAPAATDEQLALVHTPAYIGAVKQCGSGMNSHSEFAASAWGLGPGDTPAFPDMHAASALIAGGTFHAVQGVMEGRYLHAFNPMGGLHHAMPGRASGFCVYNDPAIGIAAALQAGAERVLYLDFDAHHGDGVQTAFYADPRVLTLSIHESGAHLFPGTGFVDELGEGPGRGYSLNLPMQPSTGDAEWLAALDRVLPAVTDRFIPDLIVSQHGCDSHAVDPLTHLGLSTRAFAAQAERVHEMAHRLCGGRWVATGGGGYDWVRVVPRSWALVWAAMSGSHLADELPEEWKERWSPEARQNRFWPLPGSLLDPPTSALRGTLEAGRYGTNEQTVDDLLRLFAQVAT